MLTLEQAKTILHKHVQEPHLKNHALAVSAAMGAMAAHFGAEAEYWRAIGYLHDVDYEKFPEEHCVKARELLAAGGANEELIHAVCSHGWGLTGAAEKPEHLMEKVLFAADELTGLIWAAAIIRPSKSVMDMELKSVKKKFKTLSFAAGCNREVIEKGAAELGWELDKLIEQTILAMRSCEAEISSFMAAQS